MFCSPFVRFRSRQLGALLVLIVAASAACDAPAAAPTTTMPAQRFELRDSAQQLLAAIDLSFVDAKRSVRAVIYSGDPVDPTRPVGIFTTGARGVVDGSRRFLTLYEPDGIHGLDVDLVNVLAFHRDATNGRSISTRGRGEMTNAGKLAVAAAVGASVAKSASSYVAPSAARPPLAELMPTQDAQFADRDQQPFLTAGLSHQAEPTFAVLDDRGQLSGVINISANGNITIHAYDSDGARRVTAFLQATEASGLFVMDGGSVDYMLDPQTLREVEMDKTAGAVPWIARRQSGVIFPIVLYDQRHRQLWSAP